MDNQKDDRLGTDAGAKPRRRLARRLGLLSGPILGGAAAGFVFGQLAVVDTPTYCSYLYTNLTAAQIAALANAGYTVHATGLGAGDGYICIPCSTGAGACPASPAISFNPGFPLPAQLAAHSDGCGACQSPLA